MTTTTNEHDLPRRDEQASSIGAATASADEKAASFTPGPWAVHQNFPLVVVIAEHAHRSIGGSSNPDNEAERYAKQIHHGYHSDEFPEFYRSRPLKAEATANARLIAAAPELYAVLKAVASDIGGGSFRNLTGENAQRALAAIAKAEGR